MSEIQSQKKQEITQEVIPDIVTEKEQVSKIGIAEAKLYKELYTGPIPHPSIMEKYEKILPGSADRILIMAEKQASHRQEMEKIMFKSQSRDSICGILFAFIISLTTLASGVAVALNVSGASGAIFGSLLGMSGIGGVIITFITNTRTTTEKDNNKIEKKDDN